MTEQTIRQLMEQLGALKQGHFARTGGRHTDWHVQCARLFEDAAHAAEVAQALAAGLHEVKAEAVLSAAVGGILPGWEVARALKLPFLYCERRDGAMTLRRGFQLKPGTRVLLIEDEVQTGMSLREMSEIVRALDGEVAGIGCIVDKSGGALRFEKPFHALLSQRAESWPNKACPLCQAGVPLDKSR